jgi:propanol-preferring alcohol dehydrogenase
MHSQCVATFGRDLEPLSRPDLEANGTEVVLKVLAAGVCHSDLHIRDGGYDMGRGQFLSFADRGMSLPHVPGHEPTGRILSTGADVPADLDRDANYIIYPWQGCGSCDVCREGKENFCKKPRFMGMHYEGAYATQIKVPHWRYLFPMGDIPPEQAAPLSCSGLTAFGAVKKVQDSIGKSPVVIIGAGGLGLMAVSLINAMGGLAPIVVDIDANKRAAAIDAGARLAIDGNAPEAAQQIVAEIGDQAAAVIDFVASEQTSKLAFDLLRKGGTMVLVGLFGGAAPWSLPMIPVKSARILGSYMGSMGEFRELLEIAKSGKLRPLPITTFPLDQANTALHQLENGKIIGRAVLLP